MNPMTGRTIGNYRVIAKLGEGGMGTVYRAIDTMVEREVALKSLKPEIAAQPGLVERFRSEAVLLARLNHPAVAHLYTFFKDGGEYFMAMEYVAGNTLEALIRNHGPIPYPRALAYLTQILHGVGHAHSLGILHRDLKPSNVMLTPQEKVKIMDFGIARALGAAGMTRDGRVIGTLEYLAPERIRGRQDDPRSDLYSVGVTLFEMLTGRLPFAADSDYDLLTAQVQMQPPRPSTLGVRLPPGVENLLMTSLEKDPDRRYASAAAFEAAVAGCVQIPRGQMAGSPAAAGETRLSPIPAAGPGMAAETRLAAGPGMAAETRLAAAPASPGNPAAPTVLSTAPDRAPDTRPMPGAGVPVAKAWTLPLDKRLAAALGVAFLAGAGWLAYRFQESSRPAPHAQGAPLPPVAGSLISPKPVEPNANAGGAPAGQAGPPPAQGGDGSQAVSPAPQPAPAPDRKPVPDAGKPNPPPAPSPAVTDHPALTPEVRRAAMAALEQTDGPAAGAPGSRPIQMAGLVAALKTGGPAMVADLEEAVARRGVGFQLTPARSDALAAAGAPEALLTLVEANERVKPDAGAAKAASAPAPAPAPPARHISRISDVRSLFVDCEQAEMKTAVRDELKKELGARIQLVDTASGADAVMKGTVTGQSGGAITRALRPKDRTQAHAAVTDSATGASLWEQGGGDHKPVVGIFQSDSLKSQAARIVKEMKDALSKK